MSAHTLWPVTFTLAALVAIVVLVGMWMALKQHQRTAARRALILAEWEEQQRVEDENRRPEMWEVESKREVNPVWEGGMLLPISVTPLPHTQQSLHGRKAPLPSTAPPVLVSVLVAHPRRGDEMDEEEELEEGVDIGSGVMEVKGDWRVVSGWKGLGYNE